MSDVVVTVPKGLWEEWLDEGDKASPFEPAIWEGIAEYHFWIPQSRGAAFACNIHPGERVYIVAHGRLRGYAPLVRSEEVCKLARNRACLVRRNNAVAVTIDEPIRGFQGFRYRWWERDQERSFPEWMWP